MSRPWFYFFPSDWRSEPRLRMCSLAARGLWIDLMSYMHEGEPYGHLTVGGISPDLNDIASLVSRPLGEVKKALAELEARQVFSRSETGIIYSRRMVRDHEKAEKDAANGRAGGSPKLKPPDNQGVKGGDNPTDIPHSYSHSQNHFQSKGTLKSIGEVNANSRDGWSPPKHGATGKGRTYIKADTPEWEAYAEDYRAVRGEEPCPNQYGGKWFKTTGEASH